MNGGFVTLHLKRNLDLQIASTTTVGTSLVLAFATSNESSHPDSDMDQWILDDRCTPISHTKSRSDNITCLIHIHDALRDEFKIDDLVPGRIL